jgi:hypothetical protein
VGASWGTPRDAPNPIVRFLGAIMHSHSSEVKFGKTVVGSLFGIVDLAVELVHESANAPEHSLSSVGQKVILAGSGSPSADLAAQPAVSPHALEERVERPGTDVVAVATQFLEHPLSEYRPFGGVMKDVHLPERQQNLSADQLLVHYRLM